MLLLATLFILFIIALAFVFNSMLDKRAERRLGKDVNDQRGPAENLKVLGMRGEVTTITLELPAQQVEAGVAV